MTRKQTVAYRPTHEATTYQGKTAAVVPTAIEECNDKPDGGTVSRNPNLLGGKSFPPPPTDDGGTTS